MGHLTPSRLNFRGVDVSSSLARRGEREVSLSPRHVALIERCYDAIVAKAIAAHDALPPLIAPAKRRVRPKRRVGHNLLLRLRDFKPDVPRFLTDPTVPFTNNLAEQDARMMKLL
jgi:transposase